MKGKDHWGCVRLLEDFLGVWLQFKALYRKYRRGELTFSDLAAFVGDKDPFLPLFDLKELSHRLFRDPEGGLPEEGRLIDLAIGSIFHEAMKLRENLYQLEVYRPSYQRLGLKGVSPHQERLYGEFAKIARRAERGLREGMAETRRLFRNTLEQVRAFIVRRRKENPLIARFLLSSERLLRQAYGSRGYESLMAEAFPEGIRAALREGALSYMKGMHFAQAERLWERYLRHCPDDLEARFLRLYCRGYNAYLLNRPRQVLTAWRQASKVLEALDPRDLETHLERMAEALTRLGRELQGSGRRREARGALRLAEKIRVAIKEGRENAHLRV